MVTPVDAPVDPPCQPAPDQAGYDQRPGHTGHRREYEQAAHHGCRYAARLRHHHGSPSTSPNLSGRLERVMLAPIAPPTAERSTCVTCRIGAPPIRDEGRRGPAGRPSWGKEVNDAASNRARRDPVDGPRRDPQVLRRLARLDLPGPRR